MGKRGEDRTEENLKGWGVGAGTVVD